MVQAQYFIRIDTYWQNSANRFVGPFASRSAAQTEIDRAMDAPMNLVCHANQTAIDIKNGIRVHGIHPRTVCERNYGMNDQRNVLTAKIPLNTDELKDDEALYLDN